jgi:hypothetical protein
MFKGRRTDLPARRMTTSLVIEQVDAIKRLHVGLSSALEVLAELSVYLYWRRHGAAGAMLRVVHVVRAFTTRMREHRGVLRMDCRSQ